MDHEEISSNGCSTASPYIYITLLASMAQGALCKRRAERMSEAEYQEVNCNMLMGLGKFHNII